MVLLQVLQGYQLTVEFLLHFRSNKTEVALSECCFLGSPGKWWVSFLEIFIMCVLKVELLSNC